ncbi:hypothetical protein C8J41_103453 [Sphingomonas sp. PP-CC-3G-468]|nr:hypothetical protein C8J39_2488 [Sphingomonas sp. PP-CC-1A-547]TCM07544.1 hypothetical protein C8J41_103453 [Sphingomonas sp. PP-CC-3G-468]
MALIGTWPSLAGDLPVLPARMVISAIECLAWKG